MCDDETSQKLRGEAGEDEARVMKITTLEGRHISTNHLATWRLLQKSNPDLSSPFFCPEFTLAVASARDGVRIAVIEDQGSIAAFFPFQIDNNGLGKPVGAGLSDYQGIICSPGFKCDVMDLLRACELTAWDFDHLVANQLCFSKFQRRTQASPLIDLQHGFAAYEQQRRGTGSKLFDDIKKNIRRLEREAGDLRFVVNDASDSSFQRVLAWKSAQYGRSGVEDILAKPWVSKTLNRIRAANTPAFAGVFSVLYAGDVPIAGHFGMRTETVWHWWFPAYEPKYFRYSPGSIVVYKAAEAAQSLGIRIIDFGKGQCLYKDRFKNGDDFVAEGSVERYLFLKLSRTFGRSVKAIVKNTALEQPARKLQMALRQTLFAPARGE